MKRFFEQIYQAILRHIDFDIVKCVILGSPGFVRELLYDFIFAEAVVVYLIRLRSHHMMYSSIHGNYSDKLCTLLSIIEDGQ